MTHENKKCLGAMPLFAKHKRLLKIRTADLVIEALICRLYYFFPAEPDRIKSQHDITEAHGQGCERWA